jgi:hypothetical protein
MEYNYTWIFCTLVWLDSTLRNPSIHTWILMNSVVGKIKTHKKLKFWFQALFGSPKRIFDGFLDLNGSVCGIADLKPKGPGFEPRTGIQFGMFS